MSGEAKFTPGPWRVDEQWPGDIQSEGGHEIASAYTRESAGRSWTIQGSIPWRQETQLANARLIAAAPDLYEAAVHAARTGTDLPDDMIAISGGAYRLLCAAVRKAAGAQP